MFLLETAHNVAAFYGAVVIQVLFAGFPLCRRYDYGWPVIEDQKNLFVAQLALAFHCMSLERDYAHLMFAFHFGPIAYASLTAETGALNMPRYGQKFRHQGLGARRQKCCEFRLCRQRKIRPAA